MTPGTRKNPIVVSRDQYSRLGKAARGLWFCVLSPRVARIDMPQEAPTIIDPSGNIVEGPKK